MSFSFRKLSAISRQLSVEGHRQQLKPHAGRPVTARLPCPDTNSSMKSRGALAYAPCGPDSTSRLFLLVYVDVLGVDNAFIFLLTTCGACAVGRTSVSTRGRLTLRRSLLVHG